MRTKMNNNTTEAVRPQSRAELRRAFSEFKSSQRYENSRFIDLSRYVGTRVKASKYMPHIGKKEQARHKRNFELYGNFIDTKNATEE